MYRGIQTDHTDQGPAHRATESVWWPRGVFRSEHLLQVCISYFYYPTEWSCLCNCNTLFFIILKRGKYCNRKTTNPNSSASSLPLSSKLSCMEMQRLTNWSVTPGTAGESTVKLIEKVVVIALHKSSYRRSACTPIAHHLELVYQITPFPTWLQWSYLNWKTVL